MARLQFKEKCRVCKTAWVLKTRRQYPICVKCHMKQIFSEEVTDKKFNFLNCDKSLYEKSRFLRNIRQSYLMYKELTENQIEAFKKAVKDLKNPKKAANEE